MLPVGNRPRSSCAKGSSSCSRSSSNKKRIAALDARIIQTSSNSDRPPSSDPPFAKQPVSSPTKGTPGAKPGHPGHRQVLLTPTEVVEVKPSACACGQTEFPRFGRRTLAELQRLVHWATAPPTAGEVQTWYARVVHLLNQHRARQDEAGKFARTLEREMASLWTFAVEKEVEPTNNRAERALRFAVLWRKIMQGTYNAKGDRWAERILSLRETCRLRGKPTFPVLVDAVTCYFNGHPPDVSWI
jgi:hypothetical protein